MPEPTGALAGPLPTTVIDRGMLPVADVIARVHRIREVMDTLMKQNVHYGVVPGTQKPSLWKPGAELLCLTFRISPRQTVEDLSTDDEIRYRVKAEAYHNGDFLGEYSGEASSNEEKYRWRKAICDAEWQEMPADQRREKYKRGRENSFYKEKQIRTSPADVANTILAMAEKRAIVGMTRLVLACSDVFDQDLEDLSEELREQLVQDQPPPAKEPQRKSEKSAGGQSPAGATKSAAGAPAAAKPATSSNGPTIHVVRGALIVDTQFVRPSGQDPFHEIKAQTAETTLVLATKDEAIAKEAASFEGTEHKVVIHWQQAKRPDGSPVKVLVKLEIDEEQPATGAPSAAPSQDEIKWS